MYLQMGLDGEECAKALVDGLLGDVTEWPEKTERMQKPKESVERAIALVDGLLGDVTEWPLLLTAGFEPGNQCQ